MNASGVIFYSTFCARSFLRQFKRIIDFIFDDQLKAKNFFTIFKFYFIELKFR